MKTKFKILSISMIFGMLILFCPALFSGTGHLSGYQFSSDITGTESDAFIIKSATGSTLDERFGDAVKTAGDVNGDGFDDFIVGAYKNDSSGTNAGAAFIYFGSFNPDMIPDVTLFGENPDDAFSYSVSTAGDVNGDGYSDVIVSAVSYNSRTGRVYIYFGASAMDNIPDMIFDGMESEENFGISVSNAGDVNNDGYDDLIVGAFFYGNKRGRIAVYFGGNPMDSIPDVIAYGAADLYQLGESVSNAGDVNNDGFDDVIAGASIYDMQGQAQGKAYIYLGGLNMDNVPDIEMTGPGSWDLFGSTVSGGSDLNGDGFSDVIVGMNGFNNGRDFAYAFFGGKNMNNTPDVTFSEPGPLLFGFRVSMGGDINGDGYGDVMVLGWIYNYYSNVYIYYGGENMNNVYDEILTGEQAGDRFGMALSSAGDVNGDGNADLVIGAVEYNFYTGKAYLFVTDIPVAVSNSLLEVPIKFELSQNYPNPFNPFTKISYRLPEDVFVTIEVFDNSGKIVSLLVNENKTAGYHSIDFNGSDLSSGMYICRIKAGKFVSEKKMILLK